MRHISTASNSKCVRGSGTDLNCSTLLFTSTSMSLSDSNPFNCCVCFAWFSRTHLRQSHTLHDTLASVQALSARSKQVLLYLLSVLDCAACIAIVCQPWTAHSKQVAACSYLATRIAFDCSSSCSEDCTRAHAHAHTPSSQSHKIDNKKSSDLEQNRVGEGSSQKEQKR